GVGELDRAAVRLGLCRRLSQTRRGAGREKEKEAKVAAAEHGGSRTRTGGMALGYGPEGAPGIAFLPAPPLKTPPFLLAIRRGLLYRWGSTHSLSRSRSPRVVTRTSARTRRP